MKIYISISVISLLLGSLLGFILGRVITEPNLGAYNPKTFDVAGVYFTTTTDNTLRNGYGGPVRVDVYGQLMISPSSTISIKGE